MFSPVATRLLGSWLRSVYKSVEPLQKGNGENRMSNLAKFPLDSCGLLLRQLCRIFIHFRASWAARITFVALECSRSNSWTSRQATRRMTWAMCIEHCLRSTSRTCEKISRISRTASQLRFGPQAGDFGEWRFLVRWNFWKWRGLYEFASLGE